MAGPVRASSIEEARRSRATILNLQNQKLTKLPEEVLALDRLEELLLWGNGLKTIPASLSRLPRLRRIDLKSNPIERLPNLPGLVIDGRAYLQCRDQVSAVNVLGLSLGPETPEPSVGFWIHELRSLQALRELTVTALSELQYPPRMVRGILDSLGDLESLESLDLRGWKLAGLPEGIRRLRRLKLLDLSFCRVGEIPEFVFDLALESLTFSGCEIREIPADILRMTSLENLTADENPIESPPPEVVKEGLEAIRNYWRQRQETGVDYLSEAKLIILGEPGAGKTSLARKIEDPRYWLRESEPSTEGIDVIRYQFPSAIRVKDREGEKVLNRNFRVNIWDFGGQEIYHATHQFFLTRRSVYILVCDDRREDTDFSYWLQVVELLSDASPLLIVQNERQNRTRDINLSSLRARFANLRDSIATNVADNRGLDRVVQAIRRELETLPHVGAALPATWKRVREALEQDPRDYISVDQYLAICAENGFKRQEDALQLSGYLHDLGICLHFQDDPTLKHTVILKPSWGTDAVYRVLDDSGVVAARGRFTREDVRRIWSEQKYAGMHDELLRLMMRFQLCYSLDAVRTYIAPQLLSSEQPFYRWDAAAGLVVRYEYEFLPKGVLTRFIVAMHQRIADEKLVWKTGVVLERDGTQAEVIEEYAQRRIRVCVSGPDPTGLLATVDDQLERLHRFFPRLRYERYLPCPCAECQQKAEPYAFPLENLLKMARKDQRIQCYVSGEMIDARQLIQDVLPGTLRRVETAARMYPDVVPDQPEPPPVPEVFVSYAWTEESNALVDRLQGALGESGIRLLRDRAEVRYKDSIRDFMRRIGQGKCVVVVISERYLKSEYCMFELLEVAGAGAFRERIFPVVLADANIYRATGRVGYVRHWEKEKKKLDRELKTVGGENLTKLQEDLNLYAKIRQLFDSITDKLRDMNALTPDQHEGAGFEELTRRILAQTGTAC
ncbi:MAG TPA: COR domain-containing protein [Bryobacteraceae bacterium]